MIFSHYSGELMTSNQPTCVGVHTYGHAKTHAYHMNSVNMMLVQIYDCIIQKYIEIYPHMNAQVHSSPWWNPICWRKSPKHPEKINLEWPSPLLQRNIYLGFAMKQGHSWPCLGDLGGKYMPSMNHLIHLRTKEKLHAIRWSDHW